MAPNARDTVYQEILERLTHGHYPADTSTRVLWRIAVDKLHKTGLD